MNNSNLVVGYGASINRGCYFEGSGRIVIGPGTRVGPECAFLTSHHTQDALGTLQPPTSRHISVGSHVWIGARVTVLPGAEIADGCVIAAGAVVSGRCEAGGRYGGVPARPLPRPSIA